MRRASLRGALAACALIPAAAAGQVRAAGAPSPTQDSAAALEAARAAQARFERDRRARLPWTVAGTGGPCGEVVGRFCWRPDDGDRTPAAEPDEIGSARLGLLIELAGLSGRIPGDRWLLGQRVRYRIEGAQVEAARARVARRECPARAAAAAAADSAAAEHLTAARTLVRSCRDDRTDGWCQALLGLVLHAQGRFAEAEAAFAAAARAASPAGAKEGGRADAGRDLRDVLDADARRLLAQTPDTAAFVRGVWLLADPFWAMPGNDRRTEHEARRVMGRLQEDARNPFGIPWGDDLRELHVRFGWEVGWERARRSSGAMASSNTAVIGHQQDDGYGFVPPGALIADPLAAAASAWAPSRDPRREGYAPAYLDSLADAEHQLAAFHRGDSLLVLAAVRLPEGDAAGARPASSPEPFAAVVFVPWSGSAPGAAGGPGATPLVVADRPDEPNASGDAPPRRVARMRALLPAGAFMVSVESLAPGGLGARARYGFRRDGLPDGVAGLSDLLLFEPEPGARGDAAAPSRDAKKDTALDADQDGAPESGEDAAPESVRGPAGEAGPGAAGGWDLEAAIRRMLPAATVRAGEPLGVGWEVYGLRPAGERVEFDVSLRRTGESFLHRAGRWLGLVGGGGGVSVRWSDPALPDGGAYARTLIVDTPPDLAAGCYALRLVARLDGRDDMVVEREVLVTREGS